MGFNELQQKMFDEQISQYKEVKKYEESKVSFGKTIKNEKIDELV